MLLDDKLQRYDISITIHTVETDKPGKIFLLPCDVLEKH